MDRKSVQAHLARMEAIGIPEKYNDLAGRLVRERARGIGAKRGVRWPSGLEGPTALVCSSLKKPKLLMLVPHVVRQCLFKNKHSAKV